MPEIRTITIDPVTRLEGHAKVNLFLNDAGEVDHAWFQVPELRGFEQFCVGRPAEEMPQITSRICGVCPTAHHMASVKALDKLFKVEPPPAARKIRELIYNAFLTEDHALHFYFLGGPDFIVGPDAPAAARNVLGVIGKVGVETGKKVIEMRRRLREIIGIAGGKPVHPVFGLPGGVARRIRAHERSLFQQVAGDAVDFARFTLEAFDNIVLRNSAYVDLIRSDLFTHRTYYMGMVDGGNHVSFYDGDIRVISPEGEPVALFRPDQYADYLGEHTEPWSYAKFTYLKTPGWTGFHDGADSGALCVAPLARLNVSDGMATPLAQQEYERFYETLGPKPVHHTLATHWARVIELMQAAERLKKLAADPEIEDSNIRTLPAETPKEGVGIVEAPRGTLIHHYQSDERGIIRKVNLIVATQNNAARIALSVEKAAKGLVTATNVNDGLLNRIEMVVRAYDPCLGCATHALPGSMPLAVRVHDANGVVIHSLKREAP